MKKKSDSKLSLALLIYAALGLVLLSVYRYQINPDAIDYISIAQKYLKGDFSGAVDGFRGPLLSWLLLPFLAIGICPLLSARILLLLAGLLAIIGADKLSDLFIGSSKIKSVIPFLLIIPMINFSFYLISPDLILACVIIFYFALIFAPGYLEKKYYAAACGVLGALAYFTKGYGFYFFIAHFTMISSVYFIRENGRQKKKALRNFFLGFIIFFLISSWWVSQLSAKNSKFTIVEVKSVTRMSTWPTQNGLFKAAGRTYSVDSSIRPNESLSKTKLPYIARSMFESFERILLKFSSFSIFFPVIVLYFLLLCIFTLKKIFSQKYFYLFFSVVLYCAGYLFFGVEQRYLWPVYVLLMIMCGVMIEELFRDHILDRFKRKVIVIVMAGSFLLHPCLQLVWVGRYVHVKQEPLYLAGRNLLGLSLEGTISSAYVDRYNGPFLAFYLGLKYFRLPKSLAQEKILSYLLDKKIGYFFIYSDQEKEYGFLSAAYKDITEGKVTNLRIFSLKEKNPG